MCTSRLQVAQAVGQPTEQMRIFAGGRELSSDAALVRNCGLGPGHVMHGQKSPGTLTSCALSTGELQRLWEGTPKEILAGLVRTLEHGAHLLCRGLRFWSRAMFCSATMRM